MRSAECRELFWLFRTGAQCGVAGALVLSTLTACERESSSSMQREPAVRFGEPVGIRLGGAGIPKLLAAVAVSERRSAEGPANQLGSLLQAAVASCPSALTKLRANKAIVLRLQTRADVLSVPMRDSDPATACVADALVGAALPGAQDLRLMVELRANPNAE